MQGFANSASQLKCLLLKCSCSWIDTNISPHQFSRTDREYLQLLRTVPIIDIGEVLVSIHEQLHFGNKQIEIAEFDRCQQAYRQIEDQLMVSSGISE